VIAVPAVPLTPAEAARRAAAAPGAFWLSSPGRDEARIARDFVGARPIEVLRGARPGDLTGLERAWNVARAAWCDRPDPPAGIPVAVGWLSYELGRQLVGLPPRAPGEDGRSPEPLFQFQLHDAVWVREADGAARILARDEAAAARLAELLAREPATVATEFARMGPLRPVHPEATFTAGVRRIVDYLHAGDAYQVNLSRRLSASVEGADAVFLAAQLRAAAAAPHAAFIAGTDGGPTILGNSPERFLSLAPDGALETRPIKGTRPRGADVAADGAAARELTGAAKDRAEHVMIVDLERNDLGRVCRAGSVEVASVARLVSLPTVHHLVSTVRGQLRPEVGLAELLAATFPGGSVTGAPKRRAMQIIDELERSPRGPYTGATGWLGAAGDLDLAIAIRTAVVRGGVLEISVGGGIVADSTPEAELAETEVKARAFAALASDRPAPPPPPRR
jgi:para-aminobenzoate synthetase component 1